MEKDYSLSVGTHLKGEKNEYRILSCIRHDGMGYTYTAEPLMKRKNFTEKVIIREHFMPHCSTRGADGVTVETPEEILPTVRTCLIAFERASEERMIISGRSTSIVNVLDIFERNNTFYYVVEYLDGVTFEEYVKSKGALTFEETRDMLSPILDAVKTLHTFHALHTEITPGHIRFVNHQGQNIPILFSLYATMHFRDDGQESWSVPVMSCEPGYAPPEQYTSIDHFSPQVDIYALAATIVYSLSGKRLPDSRELTEEKIRETLPPTLPENTVQALIHALNPDVAHRTSSITTMRNELRDFYGGKKREQESESNDENDDRQNIFSRNIITFSIIIIAIILVIFSQCCDIICISSENLLILTLNTNISTVRDVI